MSFIDPLEMETFRRDAESLFGDVFTVHKPNGYTRASDGMESLTYTQVGRTPGKIRNRSQQSDGSTQVVDVAGEDRRKVQAALHIPIDAPLPTAGPMGVGWEYELTQPGPTTPRDLVGSRWLVTEAPSFSQLTARRMSVVRLS